MTARERAQRLPLGVEIAFAFGAATAVFVLTAPLLAGLNSDVVVALLGIVFAAAVVAFARFASIAYAVPIAMAGLLSYDWYYLAPTHPLAFPDRGNLVDLIIYLSVGVLLGELAARAARRAESADRAHAEEQAALRRVATQVAREASQEEVFSAIAVGIRELLGAEELRVIRYEGDRSAVMVAESGEREEVFPIGTRLRLGSEDVASRVFRTGRPARIDDYATVGGPIAEQVRQSGIRSVVATPIVVESRLWGAMMTGTTLAELPPETEGRLGQFTELMATAIANTEARAEVERLAEEQAALRRVATLVAEGVPSSELCGAVVREVGTVLGADFCGMVRYEGDGTVTTMGLWAAAGEHPPFAGSWLVQPGDPAAMIMETHQPVRIDDWSAVPGDTAAYIREQLGVTSSVGSPIVVEGRLWGALAVHSKLPEALPPDTEERMTQFARLLDTAIANADNRDQLSASRARLVTAGDEARRRVVRDLHDGAQQRLVHAIVTLKLAQRACRDTGGGAEALIDEALQHAEQGQEELRELAHGILPAVLTSGGLRAGVDAVVTRLDLPVQVDVPAERFPEEIEASAYFIVAEALTNVMKHAHAERAEVRASVDDGRLYVEIRDDGIGGADPGGHGLLGMDDRVTALGGRLEVKSSEGGGTLVAATLPLSAVNSPPRG